MPHRFDIADLLIGVDLPCRGSMPMRSKTFTFPTSPHPLRPEKFNSEIPEMPRGTTFFDVQGIPVTLSSDGSEARAWDLSSGPRKIAVGSIDGNATSQDESAFRDTIARIRELAG
jgi:hypothetical protein